MLVTSVSAAKIERSKRPKCEVLNEGDLAHIQELVKFILMCIIVFITQLHIINGRCMEGDPAT